MLSRDGGREPVTMSRACHHPFLRALTTGWSRLQWPWGRARVSSRRRWVRGSGRPLRQTGEPHPDRRMRLFWGWWARICLRDFLPWHSSGVGQWPGVGVRHVPWRKGVASPPASARVGRDCPSSGCWVLAGAAVTSAARMTRCPGVPPRGCVSGRSQVAQSDTTVCRTVSASPVTRSVTGRPPGTISDDRRRRRAVHESGSQSPAT